MKFNLTQRKILLAGILLLATVALCNLRSARTSFPPLEIAMWYWHQPFQLDDKELFELKRLGVRNLFVRAGTFRSDGRDIQLAIPQQWNRLAQVVRVTLVLNFEYSVVRQFGNLSNSDVAAAILTSFVQQRQLATRAGLHVVGLQIDLDCPTSKLTKYAQLLHRLRMKGGLPREVTLSITALPTWFTSNDLQRVVNEVDFYVPQYYEAQMPRELTKFLTLSRLDMVERGMRAASRLSKDFYVGLPVYGHALFYDETGSLRGMFRGLSFRDAVHHPSFRLKRAFGADAKGRPGSMKTYVGEDVFDFIASTSGFRKEIHENRVIYNVPTPALLSQHLEAVRHSRPRNCRGVILFRYPELGETMTLPIPSIASVLSGRKPVPKLNVSFNTMNAPWELIDTPKVAQRVPLDLNIIVTNKGGASTFLAPDAVIVDLHFDRPGFDEIDPGDTDAVETYFAEEATHSSVMSPVLRSSAQRANTIRFRRFHLAAGERMRAGPIRIRADGATQFRGEWRAIGPGGFEVAKGSIAPVHIPIVQQNSTSSEVE